MALSVAQLGIKVTSDTKDAKKDAIELRKEYEGAAKAAKSIQAGAARARNASYAEGVDYGNSRAMRPGGTGASARDFAQQAQGLGGIVRLYATWAANIFAVTSAFGALREAAQKTRLIEASDLMSQRVGTNMLGIAKQIQEVTKHAISLEEALQFSNLGTSAGLAKEQIVQLTQIAKGAANALGRDSTDSIRRIIQGTAKQEQEILDELGIFVKAKDAYEKYAKEFDVKGGGDALTAQQKVIAYANAVKEAGEKWKEFQQVDDPFSTFVAKGQEALYSILSTINKALEPVLKFLNESPDAIKTIALLLGTVLTKQALPQLGIAFKEALTFEKFGQEAKATQYLNGLRTDAAKLKKALDDVSVIADKTYDKYQNLRSQVQQSLGTGRIANELGTSITSQLYTGKNIKATENLKTQADFENKILAVTTEKLARSKDAEKVHQKLVDLKVLDVKQSRDALVLGTQATATAQLLALTNAENLVLSRENLDIHAKQEALDHAHLAAVQKVTLAEAQTNKQLASRIPLMAALKQGLGAGTTMGGLFAANMQGGFIGLTGFARTLTQLPGQIGAAAVGLTGLSRVAALAGASIGAVGATLQAALSAFLGPVMLAITAWQLFGDKIKEALGFQADLDKKVEETTASLSESTKEALYYAQAVRRISDEKALAKTTAEQYLKLVENEVDLHSRRVSQLDAEIAKLKEELTIKQTLNNLGIDKQVKDLSPEESAKLALRVEEENLEIRRKAGNLSQEEEAAALKVISLRKDQLAIQKSLTLLNKDFFKDTDWITQVLELAKQKHLSILEAMKQQSIIQQKMAQESNTVAKQYSTSITSETIVKDIDALKDKLNGIDPSKIFKNAAFAQAGSKLNETIKLLGTNFISSSAGIAGMVSNMNDLIPVFKKLGIETAEYNSLLLELDIAQKTNNQAAMQAAQQRLTAYMERKKAELIAHKWNVSTDKGKEPDAVKFQDDTTARIRHLDRLAKIEQEQLKSRIDTETALIDQAVAKRAMIESQGIEAKNKLLDSANIMATQTAQEKYENEGAVYRDQLDKNYKTYKAYVDKYGTTTEAGKKATEEFIKQQTDLAYKLQGAEDTKNAEVNKNNLDITLRRIKADTDHATTLGKLEDEYKELITTIKEYNLALKQVEEEREAELAFSQRTFTMTERNKQIEKAKFDIQKQRTKDTFAAEEKLREYQERQAEHYKGRDYFNLRWVEQNTAINKLIEAQKQKIADIREGTEGASEAAGEFAARLYDEQSAQKLTEDLASSISTALTEGGKAGIAQLKSMLKRAFTDPINIALKAVISPIAQAVGSVVSNLATDVTSSVLGSVLGKSISGSAGITSTLSTMGQDLAAGFMYTLKGGSWAEGLAAATELGSTAGTVGMAAPYVLAAVAVLNGLGVFRKTKTVGGGLTGELGGTIQDYTLKRKSGTLFGGPDYWTEIAEGTSTWNDIIQSSWKTVTRSTLDMAKSLGLATTGLENFKIKLGTDIAHPDDQLKGIKLDDLAGKNLTEEQYAQEVRKRINEALLAGSNELAQRIIGEWQTTTTEIQKEIRTYLGEGENEISYITEQITNTTYVASKYAKVNETAIETLTRLSSSLVAVNSAWTSLGYTLVEASLAGGDIASNIVEIFGGLEKFNSITSGYFDAVYSNEEKLSVTRKKLETVFASIGQTVPSSIRDYRKLVDGIDKSTDAGKLLTAQLMELAPAFVEIREAALDLIETFNTTNQNWASILNSRVKDLGNELSIQANIDAAFAKYKTTDVYGIGSASTFKTITQDDFYKNYTSEQQGYITEILSGFSELEEIKNDKLTAAIDKAIEDQSNILEEALKAANDSLQKITSLLELLDTNIKELRNSVTQTSLLSYNQAQQFVQNAVLSSKSGILPDVDKLEEALGTIRERFDKNLFATKFEQDRAKLLLANQLEEIQGQGLIQKTAAEKQIEALEQQIKILEDAKDLGAEQLVALGLINSSIGDLAQSILNLQIFKPSTSTTDTNAGTSGNLINMNNVAPGFGPGAGGFVIGGGQTSSSTSTPNTLEAYRAANSQGYTVEQSLGSYGTTYAQITPNDSSFARYDALNDKLGAQINAQIPVADVFADLKASGYTMQEAATALGFHYADVVAAGAAVGYSAFAKGGAFESGKILNTPTAFDIGVAGEAGPEAIMPLARDGSGTLGVRTNFGGAMSQELANMRKAQEEAVATTREVKAYLAKIQAATQESADLLDEVIRGRTTLPVENEITTY